jgi:hypothetical protein
MTLNEALCGRQLFSFVFVYIYYDRLQCDFKKKHQVTLYHISSKYHNTMLYNLIAIEGALCYFLESL